jgi:hypothetical protein
VQSCYDGGAAEEKLRRAAESGEERTAMGEQCWKCATPVRWCAGVGAFCPNLSCDVVDALEPRQAWEVRIALEPPAPPAARPAAAVRAPEEVLELTALP